MKSPLIVFSPLGILLFLATLATPQNLTRRLETSKELQANVPIAIVDRNVGQVRVADDGKFLASAGWIKDLNLTIKNLSQKNIVLVRINLILPEDQQIPFQMQFPVNSGMPFWMDSTGMFHTSDKGKLLRPNETAVVAVAENDATSIIKRLRAYNAEDFNFVRIQVEEVQFDDDTGWFYGKEWRRDPANRNNKIPVDNSPAKIQSLLLQC